MAFFDDLGDQISAFGKKALRKTKDITDSTRLSTMAADEERTISDTYYQIGKLYASLHKTDHEACFTELFARLAQAEENVRRYTQQIQDLRGVQRCDQCGAEIPKGSQFCSVCGAPVPPSAPEGCTLCPGCGSAVKSGMRFCTSCGRPMADDPGHSRSAGGLGRTMPIDIEPPVAYDAPVSKPVYSEPVSPAPTSYASPAYTPDPVTVSSSAPSGGSAFRPAASLDDPAPLYDTPVTAPVMASTPAPVSAAPRCPHCGAELEPDSVFCSECGQPV